MSTSIFPSETIQVDAIVQATIDASTTYLPLLKEYAWDYENEDFVLVDGKNVVVTGKEAVKVWAWKALKTVRYKYLIYSWNYGQEFESIINKGLSRESVKSELERTIKETLLISPYITDIKAISITFEDIIKAQATVMTVYGEVTVDV
ncbi:hypothetical protein DEAC_c14310 [Desulfosporosinus acididurans]|uniref:DUF2634 domain-containing protein n=1 Tax=Desulfosporosinus acididurans TaxID=476652 RepID=A0A0J1FUT9_9FIRM|nr:DUF2634 domain-containing protein [Desulfosporosinus acididurans]KLU66763.1 hypothetical protein DEAC_c14310 [Desulfosporosinus acididurans]